jgi:hypothetical protein
VAWSDAKGEQRVKWTIRGHVTPFINLNDGTIPYYSAIQRALENQGVGVAAPTRGIGTQYSPNTGYNITTFWQVMTVAAKPAPGKPGEKSVYCASLVTRPVSVSDPVLPADFQFAIVNKDGLVIFHSDFTRNLRENFFAETDQDVEIRSLVQMRGEDALTANYMGRSHRMYIHPMHPNADQMWSVIVFRDLRLEQTMNLEMLSLATILFLVYALVATLAAVLTLWLLKGRGADRWLWPDSRKAATYTRLAIVNGFAILLLLFISRMALELALLFFAVSIPVGVLVWNLVALKREGERSSRVDRVEENTPARWPLGYAGTCATLLAVVAVLPCLSFFRVAWDFEQKLFLKRSQIHLIDDVNARRQSLRSYYHGVQLNEEHAKKVLAEPGEQEGRKFSYQDSFLSTQFRSVKEGEALAGCGLGTARRSERCLEILLGSISPPYNQLAADGRSLAKASPDIWKWTTGEEYLELQRQGGESEASIVHSLSPGLKAPWSRGPWWLGSMAFLAALFLLTYYGLRRVFLLDIDHPDDRATPNHSEVPPHPSGDTTGPFDPASLIAKLPKNLVVIGRSTSPVMARLLKRAEVQHYDLSQPLVAPLRRAASQGGGSSDVNVTLDPVEDIVRDGRPVVFYNFASGLEGREHSQDRLATLDRVLSELPQTVVIASMVDPVVNSSEEEREQWQAMLQTFIRIDLNSSPARRANETVDQFESRVSADAYYHWLLALRPRAQQLALVQLAQEKIVNPNSRSVICELIKEGLVARQRGLVSIADQRFMHFLKSAVPCKRISQWEKQGAGIHAGTLRASLVVAAVGIGCFLLYTQGAIFNNLLAYMTGLAAAVPAVMKLVDVFRRGGQAAAQ